MKKSSLTIIVGILFVLIAVVMTVMNIKKEPIKQTQIQNTEREEIVKIPRVHKPISSKEIVVVEYSTKAFLKTEK